MTAKQETTTTKSTPKKKATALKEEVVLFMGPYTGLEVKAYKSKDEYTHDDGEYGEHRYVRTERGENGKVVFEWRGPVV